MINNLNELQKYVTKDIDLHTDPLHKKSFMMLEPGITDNDIKLLKEKCPYIPETYTDIIKKYNFLGVSLGYFNLSPGVLYNNLTEAIIEAQEDPFFSKEFMDRYKIYQIGFNNTDLIYVTHGTKKFSEGEILFVEEGEDIYNPQDSQIHPIAKDFEQFLIITGNMDQIQRGINEDESNYEEKKNEFIERLRILNVDKTYQKFWLSFL